MGSGQEAVLDADEPADALDAFDEPDDEGLEESPELVEDAAGEDSLDSLGDPLEEESARLSVR